jgi:plastocyanin
VLAAFAACGGDSTAPSEAPAAQAAPASRPASTAVVTGRVPPGPGGAAVVMLEPKTLDALPAPATQPVLDQLGLEFLPALLTARSGQHVKFQSSEDVLHNVRVVESATKEGIFNVATPAFGSYEHRFERPGFYSVTCDIHPTMHADILVTTTPYYAIADAQGSFTIADVPAGAYTLITLRGADTKQQVIEVAGPRTDVSVN